MALFILGLVVSGVTAFPLACEVQLLASMRGLAGQAAAQNSFDQWLIIVRDGLQNMYAHYPWIAYGTDWLAFAHIVIAVFFIGPLIDPVRNVWIIKTGLVACVLVLPLALICGPIRQIPLGWRLIDCSFGVFGAVPLYYCLRVVGQLERGAESR